MRDLRKELEGWQDPGADLSGWKPAQPVHAPETLFRRADLSTGSCDPKALSDPDWGTRWQKIYDCRENIAGRVVLSCLGKKENALRYAMQRNWQQMVRWISNRRAAAISCSRIIISATEGYRHCIRCFVGMAFVILRRRSCEVLCAEVIHTDVAVTSSFFLLGSCAELAL